MTTADYALTTAAVLLLTGLSLYFKASKKSMITLGIFCIGFLVLSIFPTDVPVIPTTPYGLIHALAALIALICLGIAMITWSFVFNTNENWKSLAKLSLFFGIVSLLLFIVHFASPIALKGLTRRILIIWDITWLLLVSIKLYLNTKLAVQENN